MTFIPCLMIHNVHFSVMVDPQFTNDDVVYCRRHFSPGIMVTRIFEHKMGHPCGKYGKTFLQKRINCFTSAVNSWGHVRTVNYLTTLFLGKPHKAVYQYFMKILSPVTDNLLFLNLRNRKKLLHEKMCWTGGSIWDHLHTKRTR